MDSDSGTERCAPSAGKKHRDSLTGLRRKARCAVCKVPHQDCLCHRLPRAAAETKILVIQHRREQGSQSNTGPLAHKVLENSKLVVYGERQPLDASVLTEPGRDTFVLFPLPDAPTISPEVIAPAPGRNTTLVVLDGSWRQARRMSRRIPGIRSLPFVQLPAHLSPEWTLRKPRLPGQLSTAEAVAVALEWIGESGAAQTLRDALAMVVGEVIKIRGARGLVAGKR